MVKSEKGNIEVVIMIIIGLLFIGFIAGVIYWGTVDYRDEKEIEIVVKDKYIKRKGDADLYLVAGDNGETYKIEDLLWKGKFNSTDLYNELEIGKKYKVEISGIRNHFLSMYPNINKIESEE